MTRKLKIAFAIPTYNRLSYFKVAVNAILSQRIDDDFEVTCIINNSASTDGTYEYLLGLAREQPHFIIGNQIANGYVNAGINLGNLTSLVPDNIDWIWLQGDDDYLTDVNAVSSVVKAIRKNMGDGNLSIVHACQTRRSRNSGAQIKGSLFELCNAIGYHEILGWQASLVIRRDRFISVFPKLAERGLGANYAEDYIRMKISAYQHSAFLLEACASDQAVFLDLPLMDPQDTQQTAESISRWQAENMGRRYLFVVDDVKSMVERQVIPSKLSPVFWRYLNGSFWDRYFQQTISSIYNAGRITDSDRENFDRIEWIAGSMEHGMQAALLFQLLHSVKSAAESLHGSTELTQIIKNGLAKQANIASLAIYQFEVLQLPNL